MAAKAQVPDEMEMKAMQAMGAMEEGDAVFGAGAEVNLDSQRFEELNPGAMAVVIDPMKSVNGNFVIDAFRTYTRSSETTSNVGSLHGRSYYQYKSIYGNPFFQGFAPGADSWYYSILISHRKNDHEIQMLKSMDRKSRTNSSNLKDFTVRPFSDVAESNKKGVDEIMNLLVEYQTQVQEESDVPPENPAVARVGRIDAEKHLEEIVKRPDVFKPTSDCRNGVTLRSL